MSQIQESSMNIISEGTRLEGKMIFSHVCKVHGVLVGEVRAVEGSTLILAENGEVEGNIFADTLMIDGYVKGDIQARTRVVISSAGRVVGNITCPTLIVEFGAYFDGRCTMNHSEVSTNR